MNVEDMDEDMATFRSPEGSTDSDVRKSIKLDVNSVDWNSTQVV